MKADSDIKRDVEAELKSDPDINPTDIGVAVKEGVVTLTGFVHSYTEKFPGAGSAASGERRHDRRHPAR
jgi:osmotically-inducible protein OsmY